MLRLTNPHSVLAALQKRPRDVVEVRLPPRGAGPAWQRVAELAEGCGRPVLAAEAEAGGEPGSGRPGGGRGDRGDRGAGPGRGHVPERGAGRHGSRGGGRDVRAGERPGGRRADGGGAWRGDRGGGQPARGDERGGSSAEPKEGRSGGAHALVHPRQPLEPEDVLAVSGAGLWLALDCLQDPRNVGAVFRSAAFFGVRGVVLTRDRSAPLTAVSYDAASGGLEHVPFAEATNLARALDLAKERGLWILGAAEDAEQDVGAIARDRPWLLVLGNEESGLRRLTRERCDELCRVSGSGPIGSLNVSAAAAVLMAMLMRR